MNRTEEAAYNLLEDMALKNDHGEAGRNIIRRQMQVSESEAIKALTELIAAVIRLPQN